MLGFGTPWRQGQILRYEDAVTLGVIKPGSDNLKAVVITHDCDLQSPSDKYVELIIGAVTKISKMYQRAKHPRIYHLQLDDKNAIELRHDRKVVIDKSQFTFESSDGFEISSEEKQGLKQWLAAKYGRPAFPNSFEDRLRAFDDKRTKFSFEAEIASIIQKYAENLIGIFFNLGSARFSDLEEGDPYELDIYVVYDGTEGGLDARTAAGLTCTELRGLFQRFYGTPDQATLIALENCLAVADTHFSLANLRIMDQWRLEYISLQPDDLGDFIYAGQ